MHRFMTSLFCFLALTSCSGSSSDGSESSAVVSDLFTNSAASSNSSWLVVKVVDGDTLWVQGDGAEKEKIRLIGYDTPEGGECGFDDATAYLTNLVDGKSVTLESGVASDKDKYDRLLRYVSVNGKDVGTSMIEAGLAIARYDGLDGYEEHPKQNEYRKLDMTIPNLCP